MGGEANATAGLADDELVELACSGKLPVHLLEKELGDCARAAAIRRGWLERDQGVPPFGAGT